MELLGLLGEPMYSDRGTAARTFGYFPPGVFAGCSALLRSVGFSDRANTFIPTWIVTQCMFSLDVPFLWRENLDPDPYSQGVFYCSFRP